jgi:GAF domain-containing protein
MDGDRPDPLSRLDATTVAVRGLRDIFAAEEPLDTVLARVATMAVQAVPDADAVTVTVLTGAAPRTAAWTDERMIDLDFHQYTDDRGPCLESARTQRTVRGVVGEQGQEWPGFTDAAERAGIRANLSAPLLVDASTRFDQDVRELVGSLNVYSRTAAAFDSFDEGLLALYATAAAQAVTNARRWQQAREQVIQLETALASRAEINQAKGALMAMHGYTADEAFAVLVTRSQHSNVKVNKLALDLLASIRTPEGSLQKPARQE